MAEDRPEDGVMRMCVGSTIRMSSFQSFYRSYQGTVVNSYRYEVTPRRSCDKTGFERRREVAELTRRVSFLLRTCEPGSVAERQATLEYRSVQI